jgi:hypothetical protein
MNNRLLVPLLSLFVLGAAGFMAWNWKEEQATEAAKGYVPDFLTGGGKSFGSAVQYDFVFPTPTIRHDLSTEEIGRLKGAAEANTKTPGLTVSKFYVQADYSLGEIPRFFLGGVKVWVKGVTVHFGFNEMTVYISRQYEEGSCPYQETHDHEMEHVDSHQRIWLEWQDQLREAVRQAPNIPVKGAPGVYANLEEGKTKINEAISAALDPVFENFRKADDEAQAEMDTRASYEFLKQKCPDW